LSERDLPRVEGPPRAFDPPSNEVATPVAAPESHAE
jgi:hypothetical protein